MNNRLYQLPAEHTTEAKERRRNTLLTILLFVIVMGYLVCISVDFWKYGIESEQIERVGGER